MLASKIRIFQRHWLTFCTVLLAGCSGTALINAVTPADSYTLRGGLSYGPLPRQEADLYIPKGEAPAGGYPLVVFFYGGTWNSGDRADYRFVGEAMAARGVMTLVADYQLYPTVSYPEFLRDGALAIRMAFAQAPAWGPIQIEFSCSVTAPVPTTRRCWHSTRAGWASCSSRRTAWPAGVVWLALTISCPSSIRKPGRCFTSPTHPPTHNQSIMLMVGKRRHFSRWPATTSWLTRSAIPGIWPTA